VEEEAQPYPVVLTLRDRVCCVVGAGTVAERKIRGLLTAGAVVRVVGQEATPQIKTWNDDLRVEWREKRFSDEDVEACFLVFAATDSAHVNGEVGRSASRRGILFCDAGGSPGDFTMPAVLTRGELQIAVSTGGSSPTYARLVRDYLDRHLAHGHAELLAILKKIREELKSKDSKDSESRQHLWRAFVSEDIFDMVQNENLETVKQRISECQLLSQD
jgi:precorrin-2 dehydrogenase / sirohydrochlorin ferrochelatase